MKKITIFMSIFVIGLLFTAHSDAASVNDPPGIIIDQAIDTQVDVVIENFEIAEIYCMAEPIVYTSFMTIQNFNPPMENSYTNVSIIETNRLIFSANYGNALLRNSKYLLADNYIISVNDLINSAQSKLFYDNNEAHTFNLEPVNKHRL